MEFLMVRRTQFPNKAEERYRQAIAQELAAFERREKEFLAQERRERAHRLGLALPDPKSDPKV